MCCYSATVTTQFQSRISSRATARNRKTKQCSHGPFQVRTASTFSLGSGKVPSCASLMYLISICHFYVCASIN